MARWKRHSSTILTMNHYTPKERAEIVKFYFQNESSVTLTQRAYRRKYRGRNVPTPKTIRLLVGKFSESGSVATSRPKIKPRPRRSNEVIRAVRADVADSPGTSYRRRAQQFGLSPTSMWRILKVDLHFFPYKMQTTLKLLPVDKPRRIQYATNMQNILAGEPDFWRHLIQTDEAHFSLSGSVNTQNVRYWGPTNPQLIHEKPLHSPKVTVWCGICSERVIGPYFFEDETGATVTVNGVRYRAMIRDFLANELAENNMEHYWFQQDGATCHSARETIDLLKPMFPRRLISKNGDYDWPPRSPDLTAPDFFLWGYLKSKVYSNKPETLEQLKANIRHEIAQITPETLANVMVNAEKRANLCVAAGGGHLADVIFKK